MRDTVMSDDGLWTLLGEHGLGRGVRRFAKVVDRRLPAGKGRLTRRYWHNGSLDLARGARSELYAAWTEYEGRLWFARSTDGGERFSGPIHAAGDDAHPARGPALAVGPDGTVHLAWTVGEDPGANIHRARSVDGGHSFGAPRTPFPGEAHADAPKIAVGARTGAAVRALVHASLVESIVGLLAHHHRRRETRPKKAGTERKVAPIHPQTLARAVGCAAPCA